MAEPTVTPSDLGNDLPVYRPISVLAILGLSLSTLFAVLVLLSSGASLLGGGTVFLANWLLLLPLAGAGLSVVAQQQIRNSEGTVAGESLTRWGIWLAVLVGFGYLAYYLATGFAIQQQANAFLMEKDADAGFFPSLQEGNVNRAFLLTQPYFQRQEIDPSNEQLMATKFDRPDARDPFDLAGQLSRFRQDDLVQMLVQGGSAAEVIPQGVKSWQFKKGGYEVQRNYQIRTDEMVLDVTLTVHSNEADAPGEPRKWYLDWQRLEVLPSSQQTARGQSRAFLRASARQYLGNWVAENCPTPPSGPPRDETDWDNLKLPNPAIRSRLEREIHAYFGDPSVKMPRDLRLHNGKMTPLRTVNGHVELDYAFILPAMRNTDPRILSQVAEGVLKVRSREPLDPTQPPPTVSWQPVSYTILKVHEVAPPKQTD